MVEQTTAASHSLAEQTEALAKLIGRFQIDEAEIRTPRHVSPARPTMSVGPAKRSVLQRLTGRGSNLAVKRAQPSEESWEEF
jgi:methyl-accepting chemotaxis protein